MTTGFVGEVRAQGGVHPPVNLTLCIPVVRRYDHLHELLITLRPTTLMPTRIAITDNGLSWAKVMHAIGGTLPAHLFEVRTPHQPEGLAETWNQFLRFPEERLIVNDDVTFAPTSLATLVATPGLCVSALAGSNAFSCFLLRDACIAAVGEFDENISPGYAYFEDNDYVERMDRLGIPITSVDAGVTHAQSQTLASYSTEEVAEHHRKFEIAKGNFVKKWGALPGELRARREGTR